MDKLRATILTVLTTLNRPLYRTEIVKFVYMIDEMYFRHFGKTVTGLTYVWDNFGPNAIGDAIVNEAGELVKLGNLHMSPVPNQYGDTSYIYKIEKGNPKLARTLSQEELYIIRDVTCYYKKYSLNKLVKASKETESFKGVKQYSTITLKRSKKYTDLTKELESDEEFKKEIKAALLPLCI